MSSGEESQLSYAVHRSSSSEEEDSAIYPYDEFEDIFSHLKSEDSFKSDKFPHDVSVFCSSLPNLIFATILTLSRFLLVLLQLTLPPVIQLMGGKLGALNRKFFTICEDSRRMINQMYRADPVLKYDYHLDDVWRLRHESYTCLLELNRGESGVQALVKKIWLLGGPCYNPPDKLWTYLHFFWYDRDSANADASSVTPEPYCAAPAFGTMSFAQKGDIAMIIAELKEEEFTEVENTPLVEDFKCLSLMADKYWKSHLADRSGTSDNTAGLYAKLLQMEEDTKKKMSALRSGDQSSLVFPILLQNVLNRLKEEKK